MKRALQCAVVFSCFTASVNAQPAAPDTYQDDARNLAAVGRRSGEKHDYMSQAPYWWPDPSKPDGLPYIRRDGNTNPEIQKLPDRTNLGRLGGAVTTLGLAHCFMGGDLY